MYAMQERRQSNSPDGDKDIDPLVLNLTDIGQEMVVNLRHINLRAHPCYRDPDPINLYHKVGHGTLDMYVLSPSKDSREMREFLAKWHASDSKLFAGSHKKDSNNLAFPIQNLVSICALLVWQPANPEDNITRILFPGSTPQHKIFEGFERLKHLDFLKHPICSAKTLSPSVSLATLRDKPAKQKFSLIEKEPKKIFEPKKEKREPSEPKSIKATDEIAPKGTPQSTPITPTSKFKTETKTKKVVENKKIEKELKEVKKESKKEPAKVDKPEKREDDVKKTDLIKPEPEKKESKEPKEPKEPKPKPEPKKKEPKESKAAVKVESKKSEITPKPPPPKLSEKKAKLSGMEKKDVMKSSPTTPKKTLNGAATKTEISKAVPKAKPTAKAAPSLPAKSAKEANNRKVVEQKKSEVEKSAVKDTAASVAKVPAKPKPIDRKPISRRAKPVSPNKARMPGSPAKSTRSTPTASVKSDKDGVIRKVKGDKGTTDSSTVSTPSGIEPEVAKPIDKSLVEQSEDISLDSIESKVLADLKEEREVVEEIEAVLQKAERKEDIRKEDRFEGDEDITAEATDKKEEDVTEEDVTAEIEDVPKKEGSRKESQELTEEDEYLIVEKEEVYTEDSAQSGEGEQKHVLDEAQSEKAKTLKDIEAKEKGEKEEPEEKGKDDSPEKKLEKIVDKKEKEITELSSEHKEQLQEEVKEIIASAAEIVQKAEEKDDSGKKDSEDITKEPSSLSPDKMDSSEKKTTDTDMKPDVDQKENVLEKMEESQERISTLESGATTTAPTLPEDERIPLDEIKEDIDEKHVIEEVKEKDVPVREEEVVPETVPAAVKPDVKVFDVRQTMQNLQRDIVKTPDEVADLPVHEEVDPKLYKMEDFEKAKEEKPSPTAQEDKELSTPPAKEQKGMFSFFGKVADKFEKGIDKLTKKTKKDSEKDSDEKSSSKSSSPKEPKAQEKMLLEEVDMEKMFPKISKPVDKPEMFEEAKPTIADVKVAAIKETAAFIQEEMLDVQRQSVPNIEDKLPTDKLDEIKKVEDKIEESLLAKDISPAAVSPSKPIEDKEVAKEIELLKEEDIGEDAEEVKALLEEASKKFKTVKDSLRDSLESLEDKIKEEIHDTPSALKDAVKDTLEGVAEKLEEMKPHIETHLTDTKEPEKVKFDIPKDEEFDNEYEEIEGPYRDMKEAVRDIGEVLAGTAGIELEDKSKDVIEIVKKVAEVLREDDFLSDKALFDQASKKEEISPISTDRKPSKEEISPISMERKPSVPSEKISPEKTAKLEEKELALEDIVIPSKIGTAEVFPVQEEKEFRESGKLLAPYEKPGAIEVKEEPCIKVVKEKDDITSPVKDVTKDKQDAQKICAEMLKDDQHICDQHKKSADDDTSRVDVMQAGIETICVKKEATRPSFEKLEDEIEEPVIGFEQKLSPAKAELVMVTPGSTPTSPKFVTDKMYEGLEIGLREFPKLPEDIKQVFSGETPVEKAIEELIITKKKKITVEVIEYITVVKRIPRERVIHIIEEIIMKKGLPRESVVNDLEILKLKESITPEKRMEIEEYIVNEYIVKEKQITIEVIEEISIKKVVPKKIVIEIIEEIIVKRKVARHTILNVPEEVLSEIVKEESLKESPEQSAEEQMTPKIDITAKQESVAGASTVEKDELPKKQTEIEEKPVIEAPSMEKPETEEPITSQKRAEVEEYIINEYVTKGDNINIKKLEEICSKKKVPKRIIIEIIEEIIIKRKMPRYAVLNITEEELSHIKEEVIPETQILAERKKSVAEMPSSEEKKTPIELKEGKKEDVLEGVSTEEELSDMSEEIDVEEEEEVDGFISIPRRISDVADAKKKAIPEISPVVAKEHEKDVIDDFEAVEQEYKVRDVPVTSPEKADEMKEKEDIEEAMEDTTSEVIEADEKFVQETKGKMGKEEPQIAKDIEPADEKRKHEEREVSEMEIADTIEKYLDEAKEKTDDILSKETAKLIPSVSEGESHIEKVTEGVKPETKIADATGFTQEPKVELLEDDKKSKLLETTEIKETPIIKEEKSPQEILSADVSSKIDDGIVKRMLVTACSEDGREETEICPTGSITFTKTVTPDDSLKDISAKSTPDKDSLILDKDSHSGMSTPEKDSISEKSAPQSKDKISPEDSLEKSPVGPRDSQDLEDSLEKSESRKSKVPEELEDTTKPKSPMEKEDLKISDKIAEKDIPKSPKEEPRSPAKDVGEIKEMKSPATEKIDKPSSPVETIKKSRSPSPLEMKHEDTQKLESYDTTTQKSSLELTEKPKLPILPEPKKEGTILKTPESLHSEDISPAETIFSKSPTDKSEMYFAKAPITEEDTKEIPESIKEIKPTVDKELPISLEKAKELEDKIATEQLQKLEEKELMDKSVNIASKKFEQDIKSLDKSPSVLSDEKETDKPKSPSIIEKETISEKLPIFESEHYDEKGPIDEARSPSAISDKSDDRKEAERSKSPSIVAEKPDLQDVTERYLEKPKSPIFDRPDSPKTIDKTEESHDKDRSPSIASDKSDSKKVSDHSRSPSVSVEKIDFKDMDLSIERTRSPSVTSVKDDKLEQLPVAKSPDDKAEVPKDALKSSKLEEDRPDLKDIMQLPLDKSRSSSVASGISEPKELDRSKSPSIAGEKPDMKEVLETTVEKSRSPSVISVTSEQKEPVDRSKSPSIVGEKPDLMDVTEQPDEKLRSPTAMSATSDQKEPIERVKSPTISDKKEEPDRSKSPSVASEKSDEKKSVDGSRATSVTEEKPDFIDVMEPADKSRSSSVASEKAELFGKSTSPTVSDKLEPPVDRSKSPSVASDKSDEKGSVKEHYKSADEKSPNFVDEKSPHDRPISPSVLFDKPMDDKQSTEKIDIDGLKIADEPDFLDKTRSLSIISDKTEPKSPSDVSRSPSSIDDKHDQKDKSRSSSVASERLDDTDIKISRTPEAKEERSISPSLEARSRTASLLEDTLPEKVLPQEEKDFSHMEKPLDEKDEREKESKSPITSPETIEKKMQKIREKRFADFKEPDMKEPSKMEKSDDEEEDIVKVTAEKKAEIEKYILDEFIVRKRKINLTVIENLVMMYSVPRFIVMEIIEDIISRQNMPRSAIFDFIDDETSFECGKELETKVLTPQERAEVEEYITEEFIAKKRKITPEVFEEMIIVKSVPRNILITIIEEIIMKTKAPRDTIIEGDLEKPGDKNQDIFEKKEKPLDFGRVDVTQERTQGHEKPGDTIRGGSPSGKMSPEGSDRYGRDSKAALSPSPSLSPEPIPSDKSTQDSPDRSDPHIDEDILISEEKRMEIEKLLDEEYIQKGKKITEEILEEILIKTSLPRYIILEIVEEIVLKRKIPRESVIDVELYQEEEPEEDYDKAVYRYEETTDYELPHDARKSSVEYRMGMYPESGERQIDKPEYPTDYESQFHKAFVGGMTEMRTTHITTLSGKSTPEFTHDATSVSGIESAGKVSGKLPESTLTTTHITKTDVEDIKDTPAQTVTILRESKIAETIEKDEPGETAGISATVTKVAKYDIGESGEPEITSDDHTAKSDGDVVVKKIIEREVIEEKSGKAPIAIAEYDEPEVVTKVKREIIEQDEPEIITKVIRHEIVVPDEEAGDSKEDSNEYVKTITTRTTRTIVTEELPDIELAQTEPSKTYTDPTSGTSYRLVSDDDASDATTSADVKRVVTTVTTITDPDGEVITKKDVKESTDTLVGDELLEKLTETTRPAEKIIKETITTVTSGIATPDIKTFHDSGKSTPDLKQEDKHESVIKEHLDTEKFEHPVSPLIRELISDDKSYSGKSSPDISLPKDIVFSGKSTPEIPMSPLIRDGAVMQPHVSGRSTPDRKSDGRSSGTPEGFRSGEMIRTIVTTTKTVSDEGEIVTTTREVTETTNEKGETVVLAEKTDVKVDERLPSKDAAESAISSIIGSIKSSELHRSDSPGSDEKDRGPASPPSEHSSKVTTHPWGSSEERHTFSDDEPSCSPFSSTSQATHRYESTSDKQEEQKQIEFSTAAMSSSFYGELPAVPPQISAMKTFHGETGMQKSSDSIHSRFMVEKEPVGDYGEKPDAKRYVDEADLDFDKALMEHKEMKEAGGSFSSGIAPRYTNGSLQHEAASEKDRPSSSSFRDDAKDDSKGDSKKDPLEGWGTPLGLPSPKPPRKFNLKNSAQSPSSSNETTSDTLNFDVIKNWGEPLRLPSPAPVTNEVSNKGAPSTPKKERKQTKKVQSENIKNKKRSESPGKNEKRVKDSKNKVQPVYMDLAYVPHHGNSYYTSFEFFKRVRARYYVFSGTEPSREVYDALLEAKKTWEDKDLGKFVKITLRKYKFTSFHDK